MNESLFYGSPKMISYGVVVQIAGLSDWEDKHILDMAFVAYQKFLTQFGEDLTNRRYTNPSLKDRDRPAVTTTMVIDNTAYISTSLKGKGSYIYDPALSAVKTDHPCDGPVLDGLRRCQERSIDVAGATRMHRTSAKCGEWIRDLSDAKIVTITTNAKGEIATIPPCEKTNSENHLPNDWGCNEFAQEVNMHVITGDSGREAKEVADEDIQQPSEQTRYP
ncbi:unnamed protein product [Aureobasidium uvarum]|uniref:Uncharacterized protein n=1 Tax=Aureobasidium uvarum TaxID=2773716 RepID=A0A9N8KMS9_9PEZI|nr:unnamed protein product [Aureobasidium uvarum]